MENWICRAGPLSSNQDLRYISPSRLTAAFFTMDWQSRNAVQLGIERPTLDREGVHAADEILEGQLHCAVKQLGEGPGRKTAQNNEHPLCGAQIDVRRSPWRNTLKGDLAHGGLNILTAHPLDLPGEDTLQAQTDRDNRSLVFP